MLKGLELFKRLRLIRKEGKILNIRQLLCRLNKTCFPVVGSWHEPGFSLWFFLLLLLLLL